MVVGGGQKFQLLILQTSIGVPKYTNSGFKSFYGSAWVFMAKIPIPAVIDVVRFTS